MGTGGAQKCRGSGAPCPNPHPNHPLCQATSVAAIFFEVVAKAWTVATSFLRFCRAGSDGVAFMVGALGSECVVCVNCAAGRVYTWFWEEAAGSGLSLG